MLIRYFLLAMLIVPAFRIGMTVKQAQAICPRPFIDVFQKTARYVACDDGKNSTVLAIRNGRLVGIMDLRYFVSTGL